MTLNQLDSIPAILRVKHLFNVKPPTENFRTTTGKHKGKIDWNRYKDSLMQNVSKNPHEYIEKYIEFIEPREIFWLNMAAVNLNDTSKNSVDVLQQMLLVAYRAFKNAIDVLKAHGLDIVIHTGNWGAGAFGHDVEVVYTIQQIAAWWASTDAQVPVQLVYYTFNQATHDKLTKLADQTPLPRQTLIDKTDVQKGRGPRAR